MRTKRKQSMTQQRVHDVVIDALADDYRRRGYVVHANSNQQKNFAIEGMYPAVSGTCGWVTWSIDFAVCAGR